jgi:hypothetical protein
MRVSQRNWFVRYLACSLGTLPVSEFEGASHQSIEERADTC